LDQTNPQNTLGPENNFPQAKSAWAKPPTDEVNKSLSELASSIRILEDRYMNLRKKSQLTDQNFMELQKEYFKEKKHLNQDLLETKIKLQELIDEIKIMRGELKDTVKLKDIKVLSTYLDLWEPMQFVTRKQVEQLLKQD
jgi:hypothetical protein